jgi:hypothetical protein
MARRAHRFECLFFRVFGVFRGDRLVSNRDFAPSRLTRDGFERFPAGVEGGAVGFGFF